MQLPNRGTEPTADPRPRTTPHIARSALPSSLATIAAHTSTCRRRRPCKRLAHPAAQLHLQNPQRHMALRIATAASPKIWEAKKTWPSGPSQPSSAPSPANAAYPYPQDVITAPSIQKGRTDPLDISERSPLRNKHTAASADPRRPLQPSPHQQPARLDRRARRDNAEGRSSHSPHKETPPPSSPHPGSQTHGPAAPLPPSPTAGNHHEPSL